MLLIGNVDHRPRVVAQAHPRIGNDSHDLARPVVGQIRVAAVDASLDDLAQRIGSPKYCRASVSLMTATPAAFSPSASVNVRPRRRPIPIVSKKSALDLVVLRVAELVARIARLSHDTERHGHRLPRRQPARHTDRSHAGHALHALHDLTVELRDLRRDAEMRGVAPRAIARKSGEIDLHRQQPVRVEPHVDAHHARVTVDHEAGADQQDQRHRNFDDDQRAA